MRGFLVGSAALFFAGFVWQGSSRQEIRYSHYDLFGDAGRLGYTELTEFRRADGSRSYLARERMEFWGPVLERFVVLTFDADGNFDSGHWVGTSEYSPHFSYTFRFDGRAIRGDWVDSVRGSGWSEVPTRAENPVIGFWGPLDSLVLGRFEADGPDRQSFEVVDVEDSHHRLLNVTVERMGSAELEVPAGKFHDHALPERALRNDPTLGRRQRRTRSLGFRERHLSLGPLPLSICRADTKDDATHRVGSLPAFVRARGTHRHRALVTRGRRSGRSMDLRSRRARSTNQSFRRKARSGMELVGQYRERRLDPIGRAGAARDPSSRDLLLSRQASSLALPRSRVPRASDAQRELTGSFPLGELPDHGRGVASSVPKGAWRVADTRGGAHRKPISRRRHGGSGSEVSFIWTGHRGRTVRPGAGAPLRASLPRGLGRLDLRVLDR